MNEKFCRNLGDLLIHVKDIEIYGTNIDAAVGEFFLISESHKNYKNISHSLGKL